MTQIPKPNYHQQLQQQTKYQQFMKTLQQQYRQCTHQIIFDPNEPSNKNQVTPSSIAHQLNQLQKHQTQSTLKHLNMFGQVVERFKYIQRFKNKIISLQNTILSQLYQAIQNTDQMLQIHKSNTSTIKKFHTQLRQLDFQLVSSQFVIKSPQQDGGSKQQKPNQVQNIMNQLKQVQNNFLQIKDYCIKIIEVASNTEEEEDEEQDEIQSVSKFYRRHRDYIQNLKLKEVKNRSVSKQGLQISEKMKEKLIENEKLKQQLDKVKKDYEELLKRSRITRKTPLKRSLNSTLASERSNCKL